jgi:hypothetical protein
MTAHIDACDLLDRLADRSHQRGKNLLHRWGRLPLVQQGYVVATLESDGHRQAVAEREDAGQIPSSGRIAEIVRTPTWGPDGGS